MEVLSGVEGSSRRVSPTSHRPRVSGAFSGGAGVGTFGLVLYLSQTSFCTRTGNLRQNSRHHPLGCLTPSVPPSCGQGQSEPFFYTDT